MSLRSVWLRLGSPTMSGWNEQVQPEPSQARAVPVTGVSQVPLWMVSKPEPTHPPSTLPSTPRCDCYTGRLHTPKNTNACRRSQLDSPLSALTSNGFERQPPRLSVELLSIDLDSVYDVLN